MHNSSVLCAGGRKATPTSSSIHWSLSWRQQRLMATVALRWRSAKRENKSRWEMMTRENCRFMVAFYGEGIKYLYLSLLLLFTTSTQQLSESQGLGQNASRCIMSDGEGKKQTGKINIVAAPVRTHDVFPPADAAQPQPVNMLPSCIREHEGRIHPSIHPSLCFPSLLSLRQPSPGDASSRGGGPLSHVATGRVPMAPRAPC